MNTGEWSPISSVRQWQNDALSAWLDAGKHGVASVVTGAGKTIFAEICMNAFRLMNPECQFVIVVPTLALLDQWYVSLLEDLRAAPDEIAIYSGEGIADRSRTINLMVLNTARQHATRLSRERSTFLIVDECHRAASAKNSQSLQGFHVATLGLSATPERDYDELFQEVVRPALGDIIYEYDYNRARADGIIAPFELVNVQTHMTEGEQKDYDRLTRRLAALTHRYNKGEDVGETIKRVLRQRASVSSNAAMRVPVAVKLVESQESSRCLLFHEKISAAELIAELLRRRGTAVATYHSGLGPEIRRDNLRLFRRGQFDVLVSCRALDEGVNIPEASVAVIASSTASSRQRIQRLGRVLRRSPGKGAASVYTIFVTEVERRRLEQEATHLEGADRVAWMRAG